VAAASRLSEHWKAASEAQEFNCAINMGLHRGTIYQFRSFLYGGTAAVAARVEAASTQMLAHGEGGVFLTGQVRDDLLGTPWEGRLQPVSLERLKSSFLLWRFTASAARCLHSDVRVIG
jgi:class 3 adenylate cyclase